MKLRIDGLITWELDHGGLGLLGIGKHASMVFILSRGDKQGGKVG
ncbi:hypothetical protein [Calderihabitans maritimus]|uniref:Uncharacterized protein n=1 Tax=Calderihabitans maritimus TaxID=1246530 RepID=A0A1Z5HSI9_9FIRM|nr:hypothetical protein [Calderihabitans maritimus]GAW92493.1 hypothetical protein KKC1_16470 [Calderihabitans maritimus]